MPVPISLSPGLSAREAIADAIYRCVVGLDTDDSALFSSAFTKDAVFDLNGNVMNGLDAINAQCFATVSKLDTTHFINNIRINIAGESEASATCSALAQHYRPGEGVKPGATSLLTGCLYWLEFVKDDGEGLWKVKTWKLKAVWRSGDPSVFASK